MVTIFKYNPKEKCLLTAEIFVSKHKLQGTGLNISSHVPRLRK